NMAVYQNETLLGTCTLHVGGRLIEFEDDVIKSISPPIKRMMEQQGITLHVGDDRNHPEVNKVIDMLTDTLYHVLKSDVKEKHMPLILGNTPDWNVPIDVVTFSGGVSECMYKLETVASK